MKDLYKVYSRPNCSSCLQAKLLLKNKGLKHQCLNFAEDYTMADFIAISDGQKSFPLILLGEEKIGTFEDLKQHLQGIKND